MNSLTPDDRVLLHVALGYYARAREILLRESADADLAAHGGRQHITAGIDHARELSARLEQKDLAPVGLFCYDSSTGSGERRQDNGC